MSDLEWFDGPPLMPDAPSVEMDDLHLTITQPLTSAGLPLLHDVVRVYYHCSPEPGFLPKPDSYLGYRVVTLGDLGAGTIEARFHWPKGNGRPYVKTCLGNRIGEGPFSLEVEAVQSSVTISPPYVLQNGEIQATVFRRTHSTSKADHKDTTQTHE